MDMLCMYYVICVKYVNVLCMTYMYTVCKCAMYDIYVYSM